MRDATATLAAAQISSSRVPYFHFVFKRNISDTEVADYSCSGAPLDNDARILAYRIHEFPYSSGDSDSPSYVDLRNNDRAIVDLRGTYVDPGLGDVTGAGNEYCVLPRMWVKHQEEISSPGNLQVRIILEGWAEALDEEHARANNEITDPSLYYLWDRTHTPYGIMAVILDPDVSYLPFTLDALTVDDGIIDTFLPYFELNAERNRYESKLRILYSLINMTACYIKPLAENHLSIVYPQEEDAVDLTIYSNIPPWFYEFHEKKNEVLPNTIGVFCNNTDITPEYVWPHLVIGWATDWDAYARYGDIYIIGLHQAPTVLTQTDCSDRAYAILAKNKAEESEAYLVMPSDCRQELYDRHKIYDYR